MILAESEASTASEPHSDSDRQLMTRLGMRSLVVYRQLIDDPAFWGWFTTPEIPHVEQSLRFDAQTTAKRANDPKDKRKTPG